MSKRAERIKDNISILTVLNRYRYDVYEGGGEQQFRCNLHGDGSDNAPSARVYPESQSWFCFACGKARDAISTVMEVEGLDFSLSCKKLEMEYGLPVWEYKGRTVEDIEADEGEDDNYPSIVERRLQRVTHDRDISLQSALKIWEAVDMLYAVDNKSLSLWKKLYRQIPSEEIEDESEEW